MHSTCPFDLFVFHRNPALNAAALQGGASGIVVDFETRGKVERQSGFDTEINDHDWRDIREIRQHSDAYIICRINSINHGTDAEVNQAIELGVNEILIPMVRNLDEVTNVLELVDERVQVSAMIETMEAVKIARQLDQLPIARIYIGLNDLSICRGSDSIFSAVADGTVESIREKIQHTPFGFGGLTIPGYGAPLPVELFLHEMTRLNCQFTFLRRSFFRDTANRSIQDELPKILSAIRSSMSRNDESIRRDKSALGERLVHILSSKE
jgi:hypothetical protein